MWCLCVVCVCIVGLFGVWSDDCVCVFGVSFCVRCACVCGVCGLCSECGVGLLVCVVFVCVWVGCAFVWCACVCSVFV